MAVSKMPKPLYAYDVHLNQYKMMQKFLEIIETWANRYSFERTRRELSNEYQHDRV